MFLPTFAIDAIGKKYAGAKGVNNSRNEDASLWDVIENLMRVKLDYT
jgi:hypothetical protein